MGRAHSRKPGDPAGCRGGGGAQHLADGRARVAWLLAVVEIHGNERPNATTVAMVLVVYTAASIGNRWELIGGLVSSALGGAIASLYLASTGARFTVLLNGPAGQAIVALLTPLGVLGFAWLAGVTMRALRSRSDESQLRIQAETEAVQALDVAQAERLRTSMARDVHDIVGHSLAVIIAQADSTQFLDDVDRVREVTATIAETARRSLGEVRDVLSGTSTSRDADEPQDLAAIIAQVRVAGVTVQHDVRGKARALDPARALVLRRVAQEMLTNALRHGAPGRPIDFRETWRTNDVVLEVDNEVLEAAPVTPGAARSPWQVRQVRQVGQVRQARLVRQVRLAR
ncbi:sensor histidine kinase [Frondihabitans sp. PAMC 28766]|uniref:sensor histidine kinase n=1 Tax=Frondihabitans sp. PAMC 28766 TaxID=1795630 RepID=UPI0012FFD0D0|nr:histidine kinase [Frondihabitans sp. PAMC 28766]